MLERAIENWLDKASERSFQVPFCYMLVNEGYTILHVSRHDAMEFGKDVVALDAQGNPCAFQLKGGNLSLNKWRKEVRDQVGDLVELAIEHPSIDASEPHRSIFVTNGKIEEEAAHAIDAYNKKLESRGYSSLETLVGGELVKKAKALQTNLWPSELTDAKTLLELYLHDGRDVLPKAKLASLLGSTLPFEETRGGNAPSGKACNRAIASTAVLTALVLSNFTEQENHVAEVEAWTLYVAYSLALAERWKLQPKHYEAEVEIALQAIKNALTDLAEEVVERKHLAEVPISVDAPFYRVRITWVTALLCILGLWRRADGEKQADLDRFIPTFVQKNGQNFTLWGEAAVSQFLAIYWHIRFIQASSRQADMLLGSLANTVLDWRKPGLDARLPDIYLEAADCLPYMVDIELKDIFPTELDVQLAKEPLTSTFRGYSHTVEGLIQLMVQQNWKRQVKLLWPDVTRIELHRIEFVKPWHFYLWHNDVGTQRVIMARHTQSWDELKGEAFASSEEHLPALIRRYPLFVLLFICVYPHRTNAPVLRWLNVELKKAVYRTAR